LTGFGSGIFYSKFHRRLLKFVNEIPRSQSKAFIFSTSGYGTTDFHKNLRNVLEGKGYQVVGDLACKAWDTWTPLKLVGGINKGDRMRMIWIEPGSSRKDSVLDDKKDWIKAGYQK